MSISEDSMLQLVLGALTAALTGLFGCFRYFYKRLDKHDERLNTIERDMVCREAHDKALNDVYCKIDTGLSVISDRLDNLYNLLIGSKP